MYFLADCQDRSYNSCLALIVSEVFFSGYLKPPHILDYPDFYSGFAKETEAEADAQAEVETRRQLPLMLSSEV